MNQQNQESGTSLNVPVKRKRGRPRKEGSAVQGQNVPVIPCSNDVLNSNQTAGRTDDCDDEMVGKLVTGVIEGTFNAGYLLNVKVADTDAVLRGLVFVPGQFSPVTVENDVAPHIKMIKRKEMPIPVPNSQAEIQGSVPSSVQCNKQPFEPELQVPVSQEQVPPTGIHSSISQVPENQSASTSIPISISSGGIPQGTSEPGRVNQSTSIMSELDSDKMIKQGQTSLLDLDVSTQVKESNAGGGETKEFNLVPSIDNTNKELRTGQQVVPCVDQLNEVIHGKPNTSNIEFNLIPLSTEPEALPSEQTSKTVNYFEEKRELPKTDVLEDTKTKPVIETLSNVDTSNLSGRPSTDAVNTTVVGSNDAHEASQSESMQSEQIGKSVPSDPDNYTSFGAINEVDFNQPNESLVNSMETEEQIESGISKF